MTVIRIVIFRHRRDTSTDHRCRRQRSIRKRETPHGSSRRTRCPRPYPISTRPFPLRPYLEVKNSTISRCEIAGIAALSADSLSIVNTTIEDVSGYGVFLTGVTGSIRRSTLQNNETYGVLVQAGAALAIDSTTCSGNERGVAINGGAGVISDCSFDNQTDSGVWVYSTSNVAVTTSDFTDNVTGVYCESGSDIAVTGNTLSSNNKGILCDESAPDIVSNTIGSNTGGVWCYGANATPTLQSNDMGYNGTGLGTDDGALPLLTSCVSGGSCNSGCTVGNSIYQSTGYHVTNWDGSTTVDARCNYWGKHGPASGDFYGNVDYTPYLTSDPLAVSARPQEASTAPVAYALEQNYPNPFNPTTQVRYDVPQPGGQVSLRVYNVRGQLVRILVDEHRHPGTYNVVWDGRNEAGTRVSSGVYFLRMDSGRFTQTKKLVVLK